MKIVNEVFLFRLILLKSHLLLFVPRIEVIINPRTTDANVLVNLAAKLFGDSNAISVKPFLARITFYHKSETIITSSANAILLVIIIDGLGCPA